jgi:hypothetical protein
MSLKEDREKDQLAAEISRKQEVHIFDVDVFNIKIG